VSCHILPNRYYGDKPCSKPRGQKPLFTACSMYTLMNSLHLSNGKADAELGF